MERKGTHLGAALVSIIGPPGVGKTTLAEALAADLPAGLIREDYAGNPFLAESYVGDESARLPGQLFFLMARARQLARSVWPDEGLFVSDYGFCQDRVYARMRLGAADFGMYERVAGRVAPMIHPPTMLVILDASADTLRSRVVRRGRSHERVMDRDFFEAMRASYAQIERTARENGQAVRRVDGDAVDLRDPARRAELVAWIREQT